MYDGYKVHLFSYTPQSKLNVRCRSICFLFCELISVMRTERRISIAFVILDLVISMWIFI